MEILLISLERFYRERFVIDHPFCSLEKKALILVHVSFSSTRAIYTRKIMGLARVSQNVVWTPGFQVTQA